MKSERDDSLIKTLKENKVIREDGSIDKHKLIDEGYASIKDLYPYVTQQEIYETLNEEILYNILVDMMKALYYKVKVHTFDVDIARNILDVCLALDVKEKELYDYMMEMRCGL